MRRARNAEFSTRFTFALQAAHAALTGVWLHVSVRAARLFIVLAIALAAAAPSAAAPRTIDRGIILKVRPPRLVLRELDGTRMRFRITPLTVVKLDGRRVRLRRLLPGDVAVVVHDGQFVTAVRAFSP